MTSLAGNPRARSLRVQTVRLLLPLLLAGAITGIVRSATSTVVPPPTPSGATPVPILPAQPAAPSSDRAPTVASAPPALAPSSPIAPSPIAPSPIAPEPLAPAPTSEVWSKTPVLTPRRAVGPRARACQVQAVGEWFKVRCLGLATSAITELGGNSQNVYLHLDAPNDDGLPREGVIVFALQPRARRVFSFWTLGDGYDGPLTVIAGVVVQAYWQGNEPVVLLHDALNQPVRTAQSELRARAAASATTAKEPRP